MTKRTRHDGIRTLEGLKDRCRIDEETGCWVWSGATRKRGGAAIWLPALGQQATMVRALEILHLGDAPAGKMWIPKCRNVLCGNPDHRRKGTPSDLARMIYRRRGNGHQANLVLSTRRALGKIDAAKAEEIRISREPAAAMSAKFGIHTSQIFRIRRGEAWAPLALASVFTWRP